ncbi:putative diacyglycerol O-acyltransferase tgs2 [Nocardia neocaledoniensis NBRC 108232]|uniref:Diacylglycerol O-acyltransferase n=1 Tax=Nocardia neocaledoniensis TaxID=236511 RepID=A0A317NLU9_9NOCA|nr:wax ester/triacylglycerol synthase family O-acyltransferase [Nocardia neocaledoniensis]PWV76200.1 diacylglycerol O-acyltransferase [Nocardia neocaledoniensis]GEM31201.1 putative diacyglycerol O-acyltransferase tgs2 [Nocardia neocaledoniensis NBRC 108232]
MEFIAPLDALFLLAESREHPMHVGSLQLFEPPEDAGPNYLREFRDTLLADQTCRPTFRKRPATWLGAPQLAWTQDAEVDLDYHVKRSALPAPGRMGQLLDHASTLHSALLDRHRPLWELHFVEGLADGRFALYSKMHHALIDGVSAQRLLRRTLTTEPSNAPMPPWNLPRKERARAPRKDRGGLLGGLAAASSSTAALMKATRTGLLQQQLTLPFEAPRTLFNVPIGGARTCAVRSWSMDRIKQVKKATGTTVNDVVLAMSAGALRGYLLERDALPDKPMIALVPMSLRDADDTDTQGVKIAALLCNLGTDIADPLARLQTVSESTRRNKEVYRSLTPAQTLAVAGLMLSPMAAMLLPGFASMGTPPFNIVISNVPGARESLYWNGSRLDASYPLSIPLDGQAVNITLTSNGDNLDFGLVGCRRTLPDLHRLLDHLEDSLAAMEDAAA